MIAQVVGAAVGLLYALHVFPVNGDNQADAAVTVP